MKIGRFVLAVSGVTILAMGYVGQRVGTMTVSYELRRLERVRAERLDEHRVLHYNVMALTSPKRLYERLKHYQVVVEMPTHWEVVHAPRPMERFRDLGLGVWSRQWLSRLVGGGTEAEARPLARPERSSPARPPR